MLDAFEAHIVDQRFHVVASPGAGKTTLGLEVFRRLGQPAVVLAPTRTIRDQWIGRLKDFVPAEETWPPPWTSQSLDDPRFFTALTYQALHTRYRATASASREDEEPDPKLEASPSEAELQDVVTCFKESGIRTVILDEAHHLRAAWWKVLSRLVVALGDVHIVSLTATPPYDVVGREWKRYEDLCGAIDEEISVPELVRSGTLCPHQDYVWAVAPGKEERVSVVTYDRHVREVTAALLQDLVFQTAVQTHTWVWSEEPNPEAVLDDPAFGVALLIYLKVVGAEVSLALLELFDTQVEELPGLDRHWWQVLVHRYLFAAHWPETDAILAHREGLKRRLRSLRLLYRRELRLEKNRSLESHLATSTSKIQACVEIHALERRARGDTLRQVILTDYIREGEFGRLGAWTVFYALAQSPFGTRGDIALLTGRRVLVHQSQEARIAERVDGVTTRVADGLEDYVSISVPGGNAVIIEVLTQILTEGHLHTLVGTRSLLGEGWDAPAVNSLVLASYVGSYMLTNQMRGRAIRKDRAQPDKVSSIWHLVAVDTSTWSGKRDLEQLERRFETFVGLAEGRPVIESGLDRLKLPTFQSKEDLRQWNEEAVRRLARRGEVAQCWREAAGTGEDQRMVPSVEMRSRRPPSVRDYVFANTAQYLFYSALSTLSVILSETWNVVEYIDDVLNVVLDVDDASIFAWTLLIAGIGGLIYSGPQFIKALVIALRHAPISGTIQEIALVLRDALCEAGVFQSPAKGLPIETLETAPGVWSVAMRGGSFYERSVFSDAMAELLEPIENPRYLITRRGYGLWNRRVDYHAVPTLLAAKKHRAEVFVKRWRKRIGPTELIYTRNREGRIALLKARGRSLSGQFADRTLRRDRWH